MKSYHYSGVRDWITCTLLMALQLMKMTVKNMCPSDDIRMDYTPFQSPSKSLIKQRPQTGAEYRFSVLKTNLSQKTIGELFGVDAQTVARWGKRQNELPKMADVRYAVYNGL